MKQPRAIVACEKSGTIRDALENTGMVDSWSCDIQPTTSEQTIVAKKHYQCDVLEVLDYGWDLLIAHPPCTYLTRRSGYWVKKRNLQRERELGINFFMEFVNSDIRYKAIENPIGIMSTIYRKPDQIIQPYCFGDPESKATCLWLFNLPNLIYSKQDTLWEKKTSVEPNFRIWPNGKKTYFVDNVSGKNRAEIRSRTFPGIASAMAEQWTEHILNNNKQQKQ